VVSETEGKAQKGEDLISLGPNGPRVAPLGLGTWQWGDRLVWDYGRGYGDVDLAGAFDAAIEGGVTLFDTAEIYGWGRSERLLGRLIRGSFPHAPGRPPVERISPRPEEDGNSRLPVVATKFMPLPWRLREGDLPRALRGSLRRLGMHEVGLNQIHWPISIVPIETWMSALADAVREGRAGAVGVSNYSAEQTRRAYAALERRGVPLASNQMPYSLLQRRIERNGVLKTCRELGVTLIAYSPLGSGLLSGKYSAERPPSGWRGLTYRRLGPARVDALVGLMREIGQSHGGKTPSQVALNWLICQGTLPIPGAKNAQQARENAGALGWRLTADELAVLDQASAGF
jgi:aryl-alcohol dehydrogenase-like predicted oxidoreductase